MAKLVIKIKGGKPQITRSKKGDIKLGPKEEFSMLNSSGQSCAIQFELSAGKFILSELIQEEVEKINILITLKKD